MIIICIITYFLMASISEYMKGYANPVFQARTSGYTDSLSFLLWPFRFPSTVGNYGAAKRQNKG